jgi:hypothetical protein
MSRIVTVLNSTEFQQYEQKFTLNMRVACFSETSVNIYQK